MQTWQKNTSIIFILLVAIVCIIYVNSRGIVDLNCTSQDSSYHYNLLTINAIFAGFLFTGLGIMVSVADKPNIKRLNQYGYLDRYYNAIYISLVSHIISIVASVALILDIKPQIIFFVEKSSLIIGIVFFIVSAYYLTKVVKKVRTTSS